MKDVTVALAAEEAMRFLRRVNTYQKRVREDDLARITGCREAADVKRSSMDLTRVLADMRQGR